MLYDIEKQDKYPIQYPCIVTQEEMDDYIEDIRIRVSQGRLPPEDIKIVWKYEEYKKCNRVGKIDFIKLMNYLISET